LAVIHQILVKRLACLLNKEPVYPPVSCVQWRQSNTVWPSSFRYSTQGEFNV